MTRKSTCYLIRHSERLDKIDKELWLELVHSNTSRHPKDFSIDTSITENGILLAQKAVNTLTNNVSSSDLSNIKVIFSSRMRRCIETAYYIAKEVNLPLCISRGLALSVSSVNKKGPDHYNFMSIEDIRHYCDGVTVIDGDNNDDIEAINNTYNEVIIITTKLSKLSWYEALDSITLNYTNSITVLHSEIIKSFTKSNVPVGIPYCCICKFIVQTSGVGRGDKYELKSIYDCEGNSIECRTLL